MNNKFDNRMKAIYFFLIIVLFYGCKKEQITKEVLIKYELNDDVSPVKVKFSVDGEYSWSEWMFDKKSFNGAEYGDKGSSSWTYMDIESDLGIVNFSGFDKNDIHYVGEASFPLPKVATKVEFTGLSAESLSENFADLNGDYILEFTLFKPNFSNNQTTTIHLKDRKGESVEFEHPILFDITNFYNNSEFYIEISMYKINQPNLLFMRFLYLKTAYLTDRLEMDKVQFGSTEKHLFIETDWKP